MNKILATLILQTTTLAARFEVGPDPVECFEEISGPPFWTMLRSIGRKVVWTDALLFIYVAAFLRQYLWVIPNNSIAWALTTLAVLLFFSVHLTHREESPGATSFRFWLVVGLPLIVFYALRAPFPDQEFDVLNYHLVNSARALKGWPLIPGDFFPTVIELNPAPDMVTGLVRSVLGYRLGTLINCLALLWAASVAERFLRSFIKREWLRMTGVLFVISTEYILFLLNNYHIDLLAVPLLLEATCLSLRFGEVVRKNYTLVHIALFLGMSAALKLSNLMFVLPIAVICAYNAFPARAKLDVRIIVLAAVVFILPQVPFSLYMYWQTGNPVFPFYNKIFRSPYLPTNLPTDPMYGPQNIWETVVWPIWAFFAPYRISELTGFDLPYTGRVSLGFIVAGLGLLYRPVGKEVRNVCLVTLLSSVMWSMITGNVRYGIYLEVVAGMAILCLFARVCAAAQGEGKLRSPQALAFILLFGGLMATQLMASYRMGFRYKPVLYSETTQPTIFVDFDGYVSEARNFLSDQSPDKYLSEGDKERFDKVEVWINSFYTTSGVEVTLKKDIPMLSVCDYIHAPEFLNNDASRRRFAATWSLVEGKRAYSLSRNSQEHLKASLSFITRAGLTIGEITPVTIPFYSERTRLKMVLIEVLPPGAGMDQDAVSRLNVDTILHKIPEDRDSRQ